MRPALVQRAGVEIVRPAEAASKGLGAFRDRRQMDVIAHQAIAQQPYALARALLVEQTAVGEPIVVVEESGLAVVPPLCEVVRYAHRRHPSHPC